MATVATFKSKTGRGTIDVRHDPFTGKLACSCGRRDCDHMLEGTLAAAAGASVSADGVVYEVVATFPSESSRRIYDVKRHKGTGALSCNCRGWIFKKHCRHVAEVR